MFGLGLGEGLGEEGGGEEEGEGDVVGDGDKVGVLYRDQVNSNSKCQQLAQHTRPSRRSWWRGYSRCYLGRYLEIRNVEFTDHRDRSKERTAARFRAVFALGAALLQVRSGENLRDGEENKEQVHGLEHGEGHLVYSL